MRLSAAFLTMTTFLLLTSNIQAAGLSCDAICKPRCPDKPDTAIIDFVETCKAKAEIDNRIRDNIDNQQRQEERSDDAAGLSACQQKFTECMQRDPTRSADCTSNFNKCRTPFLVREPFNEAARVRMRDKSQIPIEVGR